MSVQARTRWSILILVGGVLSLMALLCANMAAGPARSSADQFPAVAPLGCGVAPVAFSGSVPSPALTRMDFTNFAADAKKLQALRNGIAAMMSLDTAVADKDLNCLGWKYQAYIHGTTLATFNGAGKPATWRTCQHSSWFFLSWHRMELFFFERIVRAMSGNSMLTLPYWNFSVVQPDGSVLGTQLPHDFRVVPTAKVPNSLWWPARNAALNNPVDADAVPLSAVAVATKMAFAQTAFFTNVWADGKMSFGGGGTPLMIHPPRRPGAGQIEDAPHDLVHGAVGDGTVQSMSNPAGAGLDPVFWPVHANIDRAWSCWQMEHPGSEPKSDVWLKDTKFTFFDVKTNTDGSLTAVPVTMTGQQIIDTAKQLGYIYADNCKGFQVPSKGKEENQFAQSSTIDSGSSPLSAIVESPAVLAGEPVTVSIRLPRGIQNRIETLVQAGAPPGAIRLTVGGLAVDNLTGAAYEIYLNLPAGAVPDDQSEYYADDLSFFGIGYHQADHAESEHAASLDDSITYDITDVVRQLIARGEWPGDQVTVTFANTAADTHTSVKPPAALPGDRARFAYLRLMVQ